MTRKHFEAIAADIKAQRFIAGDDQSYATVSQLAHRLADTFEGFNPNFNRDRFLEACGF